MQNTFEKDISFSLDSSSDNNLTIFKNKINSNDNHLFTDSFYILEKSTTPQNEKNLFDISLTQVNKDNINKNFLDQNLYEFDLQSKEKINNIFPDNQNIPLPIYEDDIIRIINNKMNISYKFENILNSVSNVQNDSRIEIVKKEITKKLNTRSKRFNKGCKNKKDIKYGRKKKEDLSVRLHNKYSSDNIIIKIKNIIKKYLIMFVNNINNHIYFFNYKLGK